jgi:hypothetical protein
MDRCGDLAVVLIAVTPGRSALLAVALSLTGSRRAERIRAP